MPLRASKVALECVSCGDVQINPRTAVAMPVPRTTLRAALWCCPCCLGVEQNALPAVVTVLCLAGARQLDEATRVTAERCGGCGTSYISTPAESVLYLPPRGTGDPAMHRTDCPVCDHAQIGAVSDVTAAALGCAGTRLVSDALDLVPDEADALTDSTVDLHELLAAALAVPAPRGIAD